MPAAAQNLPAGGGTAQFSLSVPQALQGGPPVMHSVVVTVTRVNGAPPASKLAPTLMNLAPDTAACKAGPSGTLNCSVSVAAPTGDVIFSVVSYAQTNGTGTIIASTQAEAVIVAGKPSTCIPTGSVTANAGVR